MHGNEVFQRVRDALAQVEAERNVRVLFACESGSRAWGFASRDSDYDVRFLYVHRRDSYLSVEDLRTGRLINHHRFSALSREAAERVAAARNLVFMPGEPSASYMLAEALNPVPMSHRERGRALASRPCVAGRVPANAFNSAAMAHCGDSAQSAEVGGEGGDVGG
jgi:hypothetical protein